MVSIRARLITAFFLLIGLGFYYLTDTIRNEMRPIYLQTMEESLIDTATVLAAAVEQELKQHEDPVTQLRDIFSTASKKRFHAHVYDLIKTQTNLQVYLTDAEGVVIFDSDEGATEGQDYAQWNDVYLTLRGQYGARSTRTDPDNPKSSILHVAARVEHDGAIAGVLTVLKPVDSVTPFLDAAEDKVITAGVLAMVLVVLLSIAVSLWITRPIAKLTTYAQEVEAGNRVSLPRLSRNEIGELGQAFESMRNALENKQYVERYVQSLTHEIKSPLSSIQGAVELLKEDMPLEQRTQFLQNLHTETERIQNLVDRMLLLSSLENRSSLEERSNIDVSALCEELEHSIQPLLTAKALTLKVELEPQLSIQGDPFLVRQALLNLLQNAIAFSPEGASILLQGVAENDAVALRFQDQDPGIPDYAQDKIFQRFYSLPRPESGKKSSGLGLALVQEVAHLHGGTATVANSSQGGCIATLTLPQN